MRRLIGYADTVSLGSRIGRPWYLYMRNGHYMVEVGWSDGGPNTTHPVEDLQVTHGGAL